MASPPPRDTSPLATAEPGNPPPVIFRSKRKRPTLRSRQDEAKPDAAPMRADSGDGEEAEETEVSVAELLRQRRRQTRLKGIGFAPEKTVYPGEFDGYGDGERAVAVADGQRATSPDVVMGGIPGRFAPQTGLVGELVNKHMMEYVESKLASRQAASTGQRHDRTSSTTSADAPAVPAGGPATPKPTILGKLMEVDLGEEARDRNVALTERARRRLAGEPAGDEESAPGGGGKRPPRGRNRRGSHDIKRDQLVEQFLHENRPDVNIPIKEAPPAPSPPSDTPADDRIAEEFKREFLDAVARRRQRRRAAKAPARPGDKRSEGEVLKGPKLGGSRNVRSAMRDILLQKQEDKGRVGSGRR